jgi:AcrR family transcriptional regulator
MPKQTTPKAGKDGGSEPEAAQPLRADARRNRQSLLDAAIELILEVGGEPSRDSVAERAGVGIGTLYRHFPDQQSLLHAVVRHALERSIAAGEAALADTADGFDALRQYMHAAVDNGIGAVNLIYPLLEKPRPDLRARAAAMIHSLIERGQGQGRMRCDVTPADIVFATIRFSRRLAVGLSVADERAVAHRHIDIYVDGLGMKGSGR